MTGFVSMGGGGPDYIQPGEPQNPQNGELWFDTDAGSSGNGELKIYDGDAASWKTTGFTAHGDLTGVTADAHHNPVTVSEPLTEDGTQGLGMLTDGTTVTVNANGEVSLSADGVGTTFIAPDAVTDTEVADSALQAAQNYIEANGLGFNNSNITGINDLRLTDNADGDGRGNDVVVYVDGSQYLNFLEKSGTIQGVNFSAGQVLEMGNRVATRNYVDTDHSGDTAAHHTRYTDAEASDAAPVQNVNGQTGSVNLTTGVSSVNGATGVVNVADPSEVEYWNQEVSSESSSGTVERDLQASGIRLEGVNGGGSNTDGYSSDATVYLLDGRSKSVSINLPAGDGTTDSDTTTFTPGNIDYVEYSIDSFSGDVDLDIRYRELR